MNNRQSDKRIIPPDILLEGYSKGIFPMSESRDDDTVNWYSALKRGIIPINRFHVSKNVQRIIRQGRYECRINTRFSEVMKECASRKTTWISELIINSFEVLHQTGHAHSVEMYNDDGKLAGGLYGVSLRGAFFGESMFKNEKEADKVALWHCHQILEQNGFTLWDTQFYTDHLSQFGCIEISPQEYKRRLDEALQIHAEFKI
jgi:leucyl/phenylalanyl-tRNA--protein transferase